MNKSEEMRSQLAPLNLYKLNGSSLIDCELESYGAALDVLQSRLDRLCSLLWVSTAGEEALSIWERRLGFCGEGTVEERREKILTRLRRNCAGAFTREGIDGLVRESGIIGGVVNDFNNLSARLYCWNEPLVIEDFVSAVKIVRDAAPAHVQVIAEVAQDDWNKTDARDYDFDRWDAMALHWDINWEG